MTHTSRNKLENSIGKAVRYTYQDSMLMNGRLFLDEDGDILVGFLDQNSTQGGIVLLRKGEDSWVARKYGVTFMVVLE